MNLGAKGQGSTGEEQIEEHSASGGSVGEVTDANCSAGLSSQSSINEAFSSDNMQFEDLIEDLVALRRNISATWREIRDELGEIDHANWRSARNLVHYLALRRYDIRGLQTRLAEYGFSSLGRSESHVMSNVDRVLKLLHKIVNRPFEQQADSTPDLCLEEGKQLLARRTELLLGPAPNGRKVRIMVTLPSEASTDYPLVRNLLSDGMEVARINCAHDWPETWKRMVANIRKAESETGRNCKICFDIPGPKLRTGRFEPGPQVLKWRPERDLYGRVTKPAEIWLTSAEDPTEPPRSASVQLALPKRFLSALKKGDRIKFKDARNSSRRLLVKAEAAGGFWLEAKKTAYIVAETTFRIANRSNKPASVAKPGVLPAVEQFALLHAGDTLVITRSSQPGKPATLGPDGTTLEPARVPCTLPEIFSRVRLGERIWFDDGKLGGRITGVDDNECRVEITRAGPAGHRLRADRGINLPDSKLNLAALTPADEEVLEHIVNDADLIGYSFVRSADDLRLLHKKLENIGGAGLPIILKIETRAAFENLPGLLLAAMENPTAGVMIARGDLAVEIGFERLAEVQEEILWMCEAAHIPVIWATQVLEQLSKKGTYSRAEITDAAMSERAECVMLNKGPFVTDAVRTLADILQRMEAHQEKKRAMMRPLRLAESFVSTETERHAQQRWLSSFVF